VKLNIKVMEAAAWLDQVNNVKYSGLYFSGDNNAHVHPGTLWSSSPGWRPGPSNNSGWKNDQWTQLVSALITEPDQAKQKMLIPQINDFVLDQTWIFSGLFQPSRPGDQQPVARTRAGAVQRVVLRRRLVSLALVSPRLPTPVSSSRRYGCA